MFWTFSTATTTGASGLKAFHADGLSDRYTAFIEAGAGSSATVRIEGRMGSSSGAYADITGTTTVSTSARFVTFAGPHEWLRPYATVKSTGALTVYLRGN